jgi:hypothetical protein
MSPDSAERTRQRRAWRVMSAFGCILGASAILLTAVKWTGTDARVSRQAETGQKAICAIIAYADQQATIIEKGAPAQDGLPARPGNPRAAKSLHDLANDMRSTGIRCPP